MDLVNLLLGFAEHATLPMAWITTMTTLVTLWLVSEQRRAVHADRIAPAYQRYSADAHVRNEQLRLAKIVSLLIVALMVFVPPEILPFTAEERRVVVRAGILLLVWLVMMGSLVSLRYWWRLRSLVSHVWRHPERRRRSEE